MCFFFCVFKNTSLDALRFKGGPFLCRTREEEEPFNFPKCVFAGLAQGRRRRDFARRERARLVAPRGRGIGEPRRGRKSTRQVSFEVFFLEQRSESTQADAATAVDALAEQARTGGDAAAYAAFVDARESGTRDRPASTLSLLTPSRGNRPSQAQDAVALRGRVCARCLTRGRECTRLLNLALFVDTWLWFG